MKHGQSFKTMAITINGNGTITGISVGGLPDGIVDTDMIAASAVATAKIADDAVTVAKASGSVKGVQEVDQWRLNANKQLSTSWNAVSADLERQDNTFSTHIGTGMSQSSGVFTFPSTGKWLIQANGYLYSSDQEMHYGQVRTLVSSDSGSNYTIVGYAVGNATSGGAYGNFNSIELIDVTNASTFRVKFDVRSGAGGNNDYLVGYTGENATSFIFTRLGDT